MLYTVLQKFATSLQWMQKTDRIKIMRHSRRIELALRVFFVRTVQKSVQGWSLLFIGKGTVLFGTLLGKERSDGWQVFSKLTTYSTSWNADVIFVSSCITCSKSLSLLLKLIYSWFLNKKMCTEIFSDMSLKYTKTDKIKSCVSNIINSRKFNSWNQKSK